MPFHAEAYCGPLGLVRIPEFPAPHFSLALCHLVRESEVSGPGAIGVLRLASDVAQVVFYVSSEALSLVPALSSLTLLRKVLRLTKSSEKAQRKLTAKLLKTSELLINLKLFENKTKTKTKTPKTYLNFTPAFTSPCPRRSQPCCAL